MTPSCRAIAVGSRHGSPHCKGRLPGKQTGEPSGGRDQWRTTRVVEVLVLSLKFFIMAEVELEVLFTLVLDRPNLFYGTKLKNHIRTEFK